MTANQPNVEFYFDPICPWCWMTSRWAAEVAEVRGFEIAWKPISLKIINEGNDLGSHQGLHDEGHRLGRVVEAARVAGGESLVGKLYTEMGTRRHPGGRDDFNAIIAESLEAAGADAALAAAADTDESDAQLRKNTDHALEIAGPDVGVPIISIDGVAFFGPVVTPAPTGDDALRLWDGIYAAASVPGFYELKRGRTEGPKF
ncbi:DsbA family protein [Leucobacter denitrificans]|uniref:DsbA family protein n=1 Tax=Leucobacter denitrificans TaxID=683042 RepID=A0A7G9S580_9MICO|nr:DsbA family protein [Leucobacter denitrificans]QNN63005.1 DsbA family protein [Leucobacter denitrificans]